MSGLLEKLLTCCRSGTANPGGEISSVSWPDQTSATPGSDDRPCADTTVNPHECNDDAHPELQRRDKAAEKPRPRRRPIVSADCEAPGPYQDDRELLCDHLRRVALLVQAYSLRRSVLQSTTSFEEFVAQPHTPLEGCALDRDAASAQAEIQRAAADLAGTIQRRLEKTDPAVAATFRMQRLTGVLQTDTQYLNPELTAGELHQLVNLQRDLLLLALLDHADPAFRGVFMTMTAEDGAKPGQLTAGMAAEICHCDGGHIDSSAVLRADVPLLDQLMIELGDPQLAASVRPLRIDPAIADYLLHSRVNQRLPPGARWQQIGSRPSESFSDLGATAAYGQLARLSKCIGADPGPLFVLLHGPEGSSFFEAVRIALGDRCRPGVIVADIAGRLREPDGTRWAKRVALQARLDDLAVVWSDATALIEQAATDSRWSELLGLSRELVCFATSQTAWDPHELRSLGSSMFVRIELSLPQAPRRRALWAQKLRAAGIEAPDDHHEVTLDLLASFQFTPGQTADAIALALGQSLIEATPRSDMAKSLYDACRRVSARGIVSFTRRIPPRRFVNVSNPLDAIVLEAEPAQLLRELDHRLKHLHDIQYGYGFGERLQLGRGLISLFSGPSGTGKTLAATVLASANERDLYQVDMSAVVSKYVGETEKNLARIFNDAQSSNAILFFDEADALFGKRGEVDKAQDRWANMEINYLLQRIEEFTGVVILATNLKQNIDAAFLRRVQVIIDFSAPQDEARRKILTAMLTGDAIIRPSDLELAEFCRKFDVSGGNLKNIVLDAAFRALGDDREPAESAELHRPLNITLEHLVLAAAREYQKLSRPVSQASFGRRFYSIVKSGVRSENGT